MLPVLDNAPGHPAQLGNFHPNVKVVYLPPNTMALLQPTDQGVIASFKAYYLRRTIAMALQATETKKDLTLKHFWKSYNILDAVKNIAHSWEEVKVTNMNGVWKKLCPQSVNDFHGFEDTVDHVIRNIVAVSKEIDLDIEVDDVTELLKSHREELSAKDLIQLEKQIIEEEEETPNPKPKAFTRQGLQKVLLRYSKRWQLLRLRILTWKGLLGFSEASWIYCNKECYKVHCVTKRSWMRRGSCLFSLTWSCILRK